MTAGVIIAESLRVGAQINDVLLTIVGIERVRNSGAVGRQPAVWTMLEFTADDEHAQAIAADLAAALDTEGVWYVDFHTATEKFVVFPGTVMRYPRADAEARREAADYARSIGIPEAQLDWAE